MSTALLSTSRVATGPNDGKQIEITFLGSRTDTNLVAMEVSWGQFRGEFESAEENYSGLPLADYQAADRETRTREKDGLAWTPATFKAASTRKREAGDRVSCLV